MLTRATVPVMRTRMPRMRRMSKRRRRGVGIKGTGRMKMKSAAKMLKDRVTMFWVW